MRVKGRDGGIRPPQQQLGKDSRKDRKNQHGGEHQAFPLAQVLEFTFAGRVLGSIQDADGAALGKNGVNIKPGRARNEAAPEPTGRGSLKIREFRR